MLRRLIEFALTQRVFVLLVAVLIAGAGGYAFQNIPIDAFPNIAPVQAKIILKAPGMTPEEVETRVITPLEMELLGIPRQTILRASAKYAIADITIDFVDGTDIYWARQQVAERLAGVRGDLPANVSGGLAPISTPLSDVFMFTIRSEEHTSESRLLLGVQTCALPICGQTPSPERHTKDEGNFRTVSGVDRRLHVPGCRTVGQADDPV